MTGRLNHRIGKLEKRWTPSVELEKWLHRDPEECPDWVLYSVIFKRPVSPAEADRLNEDEKVARRVDALVSEYLCS